MLKFLQGLFAAKGDQEVIVIDNLAVSKIESIPESPHRISIRIPLDSPVSMLKEIIKSSQLEGLYKVVIPKGSKGQLLRLADGSHIGSVIHNGKITGQARLFALNSTASLFSSLFLIDTALRAYYLGDVSKKIEKVIEGLDRLVQRGLDRRLSKLKASLSRLQRIQTCISFSKRDELLLFRATLSEKNEEAFAELLSIDMYLRREAELLLKDPQKHLELLRELECAFYAKAIAQGSQDTLSLVEQMLSGREFQRSSEIEHLHASQLEQIQQAMEEIKGRLQHAQGSRIGRTKEAILNFSGLETAEQKKIGLYNSLYETIEAMQRVDREAKASDWLERELATDKDSVMYFDGENLLLDTLN